MGDSSCLKTCCSVGSPPQAAGPARSLLQCELPMDCSFLQGTSTCSSMGSSTGCRWISSPPWSSMGCRGTACLTMVFSKGCRGIWSLEHLIPSFFIDLGVCRVVSCTFSHSSLPAAEQQFLPFLSHRQNQCARRARLWPAAGLSSSRLELALSDTGAAPGVFSQRPPLQPPVTKTLPCKPSTICQTANTIT